MKLPLVGIFLNYSILIIFTIVSFLKIDWFIYSILMISAIFSLFFITPIISLVWIFYEFKSKKQDSNKFFLFLNIVFLLINISIIGLFLYAWFSGL